MTSRGAWDKISRWAVTLVGYGVLLAFALIFCFLLVQIWPLLRPASLIALPGPPEPLPVMASSSPVQMNAFATQQDGAALVVDNGLDERVYLSQSGHLRWYQRQSDAWVLQLTEQIDVTDLTAASMLPGSQVLLLAQSNPYRVQPWFRLHQQVIAMPARPTWPAEIQALLTFHAGHSYLTLHPQRLQLHHIHRTKPLADVAFSGTSVQQVQLSNDQASLRFEGPDAAEFWFRVQNPHPEVSFQQLWQPVHYLGRQQPAYVWQASASADFAEPKLSLVPLTLGTLKAAFYAMLFATPLAILAAVYTAFYVSERWRYRVKASMEMLESMPTVILGFIAAFLLAPWLEQHLLLFILLLFGFPCIVVLISACWFHWRHQRQQASEQPGWLLLSLTMLLALSLLLWLAGPAEQRLFEGDFLNWLAQHGYDYQQRNALIIGLAMGLAVIPSIFSLTEDAVYQVPPSLTQGVLALGASRWQALAQLILPVAAPGILAAVLIGLGRAVGETMILIMATGNTPLTGFNPLEGMRTLTASLAIEMPEAAVSSSHFKVLLLAALLLFVLTFIINTLASLLRQRIRQRYQQL